MNFYLRSKNDIVGYISPRKGISAVARANSEEKKKEMK